MQHGFPFYFLHGWKLVRTNGHVMFVYISSVYYILYSCKLNGNGSYMVDVCAFSNDMCTVYAVLRCTVYHMCVYVCLWMCDIICAVLVLIFSSHTKAWCDGTSSKSLLILVFQLSFQKRQKSESLCLSID